MITSATLTDERLKALAGDGWEWEEKCGSEGKEMARELIALRAGYAQLLTTVADFNELELNFPSRFWSMRESLTLAKEREGILISRP